jgi:hypothetical protein
VPTLGLAAAPFNSWAARRAALPAWLRERRDTEYRRESHALAAGVSTGGVVAVLAIALMLTGRLIPGPSLVRPIQSPSVTATTGVLRRGLSSADPSPANRRPRRPSGA